MKFAYHSLALFATFGLAACGNHNNHAPVVYGANAPHQARIYNSRNEIYRKQEAEQVRVQQATAPGYAPTQLASAPNNNARLTPVSASYIGNPQSVQPVPAAQKVKGYIEVQRGDSVYALARRFGVLPKAIIKSNNLHPPYSLSLGQVIKLPKNSSLVAGSALSQPVRTSAAPVSQVVARDMLYAVRKGDTLYSISKAANVPAQQIAQANALRAPYTLSVGQQVLIPQAQANNDLYIRRSPTSKIVNQTAPARDVGDIARTVSYTQTPTVNSGGMFSWPVRGAVIATYGSGEVGRRNDGINIAAPSGTPVRAAADGEVVYRGSELDGFGNLLLVRHTDGFVTAYAHNGSMLAKKGDKVRRGQMIAKVGDSGSVSSPQLHFEVRQNLKSVDPATMLGNQ